MPSPKIGPSTPAMIPGVAATPAPQEATTTATTNGNRFSAFDGATTPVVSTPAPAGNVGTVTPLGLLSMEQADLALQHNQLLQQIDSTTTTFPEAAREGVKLALEKSVNRVLDANKEGRITPQEAAESLEMMREMMEALHDLRTNNATIIEHNLHGDNVQVWKMESPDGDEFMVTARTERDDKGEARVSFRHMKDDGEKLGSRHRMGLRLDLERFGTASVDVQFGTSSLDKRIHGLYRNSDGSVFETESGKKLADHHFRDGIPTELQQPERFAKLVQNFVSTTMAPLQTP